MEKGRRPHVGFPTGMDFSRAWRSRISWKRRIRVPKSSNRQHIRIAGEGSGSMVCDNELVVWRRASAISASTPRRHFEHWVKHSLVQYFLEVKTGARCVALCSACWKLSHGRDLMVRRAPPQRDAPTRDWRMLRGHMTSKQGRGVEGPVIRVGDPDPQFLSSIPS